MHGALRTVNLNHRVEENGTPNTLLVEGNVAFIASVNTC